MSELRQSAIYARYLKLRGWLVEGASGCHVFIRRIPLTPFSIIKIQRPKVIPFREIEQLAKKYHAFQIAIEPHLHLSVSGVKKLQARGYHLNSSSFLPTKTIQIDLTKKKREIFNHFSGTKRRGVRKAIKNRVIAKESTNIESFIRLKSNQFGPLGFLATKGVKVLWQVFHPQNAKLLIATVNPSLPPLAGVLLLFHRKTAHYWLAASSQMGKKLFAPTVLVWEALQASRGKGCQVFDFEGIYDLRFHQATKSWQGFTRFKKGFGGKEVEYPGCFVKYRLPL